MTPSSTADVWVAIGTWVMAAVTVVLAVVTIGAAIAAAIVISRQLRETRRSRRAQGLIALHSAWADPLLLEARVAVRACTPDQLLEIMKAARENPEERAFVLLRVPNFYDTLAVLVASEAVEYDHVRHIYGTDLIKYWDVWKPSIGYIRTAAHVPLEYHGFELLANRVKADLDRM